MFATRMKATALKLLTKYGQLINVSRESEGVFDVSTGEVVAQSMSSYSGYGNPSTYTLAELENSAVLSTDIKLYFYSTTRPLVNDIFVLNDENMRVINVNTSVAQNQDCLYVVQLRVG